MTMKTQNIGLRLIIILPLLLAASVTRAQFDPVGTIERKVEEKVEQKTDEAIDKALEDPKPEEKKEKEEKNSEKNSTTSNSATAEFKTYSKYDFIPGEKIIYFEDFSQDA